MELGDCRLRQRRGGRARPGLLAALLAGMVMAPGCGSSHPTVRADSAGARGRLQALVSALRGRPGYHYTLSATAPPTSGFPGRMVQITDFEPPDRVFTKTPSGDGTSADYSIVVGSRMWTASTTQPWKEADPALAGGARLAELDISRIISSPCAVSEVAGQLVVSVPDVNGSCAHPNTARVAYDGSQVRRIVYDEHTKDGDFHSDIQIDWAVPVRHIEPPVVGSALNPADR